MPILQDIAHSLPDDGEASLIRRAAAGDADAVRHIVKTHNQRLYRLVRAVLRSNADAEEVLQEAYLHAFSRLAGFKGEASLSTWLSRIALNEALMRLRAQKRQKRAAAETRPCRHERMRDKRQRAHGPLRVSIASLIRSCRTARI